MCPSIVCTYFIDIPKFIIWLIQKVFLSKYLRFFFKNPNVSSNVKINYFSSIFQILENDDLSKAVCNSCINGIENVRAFFQQCFNANQELIISLRKSRPCPLDLPTHINQYVRSFNPPIGKMESSVANSLCENLRNFVRIIFYVKSTGRYFED